MGAKPAQQPRHPARHAIGFVQHHGHAAPAGAKDRWRGDVAAGAEHHADVFGFHQLHGPVREQPLAYFILLAQYHHAVVARHIHLHRTRLRTQQGAGGIEGGAIAVPQCDAGTRGQQALSNGTCPLQPIRLTSKASSKSRIGPSLLPGTLRLEITENTLLNSSDIVHQNFERLRRMQVSVYLDDFGTGYSSLSYLRSFQFDRIKIACVNLATHLRRRQKPPIAHLSLLDVVGSTLAALRRMDNPALARISVSMKHDADILIVGGGLNGPALALALSRAGLTSCVIDAAPQAVLAEAGFDGRSYALALGSVRLLRNLGL